MKEISKPASIDDFQESTRHWFKKHDVEQVTEGVWTKKPSSYAKNSATVTIAAFKDEEGELSFDFEMYGRSRDFNVNVLITGIDESKINMNGLGIEARLCDAWNDLVY